MSNRIRMWGKRGSSCCQAVLWAADELGLDVELIPTGGGHGGLGTPDYVALNPNKVVPTIDDNGLVLWESAAILMYLASTYGKGTLYPRDDRARGDAYRWVVWQQTTLRNRLMPLHLEWNVLTDPMSRHLDDLEEKRAGLRRLWGAVETQLDGRVHLVGDSFTMADIPIAIMAHWWYRMPIDHFALPRTEAWYRRVAARPAFQRQVAA